MPALVDDAGWPYVALGCGYGLAAAAMFVGGALRKRAVDRSLDDGDYAPLPFHWAVALSSAGCALAVGTLLVVAFA